MPGAGESFHTMDSLRQKSVQVRDVTQKEQPMVEGNFGGYCKLYASDCLPLTGSVPNLE